MDKQQTVNKQSYRKRLKLFNNFQNDIMLCSSTKYEHHGYKIVCFTHFIEMNGLEASVILTGLYL